MADSREPIATQTPHDGGTQAHTQSPQFWDGYFARGNLPWDQGSTSSEFRRFALAQPQRLDVLIPGCGSAHEARWLAERGWRVRAIDFAPAAIEAARATLGMHRDCAELGDFFRYNPPFTPQWIFERAFLCALAPGSRHEYAARMAALLPRGAWLAGSYLLGATASGPPFSIEREVLCGLLEPFFDLVEQHELSDSLAVFAGKEVWFTWRRR
jgi:hypothetical protein